MGYDPLEPYNLERLRSYPGMLAPVQKAGLHRDRAIRLLAELQRLQRSDRRYRETVAQVRAILDSLLG